MKVFLEERKMKESESGYWDVMMLEFEFLHFLADSPSGSTKFWAFTWSEIFYKSKS